MLKQFLTNGQPRLCCEAAYLEGYLGRMLKEQELNANEIKQMGKRTAKTKGRVSKKGNNPMRTMRRNLRSRVRSSVKEAVHNDG